jgi:MinD superfamily P-loop ATPase
VTLVKQQARLLALDTDTPFVIVDGPPGIGCPVISACAGADLALLVVEPTIPGVHDLRRILGTTDHFGVRSLVLINKADLNAKRAQEVESFCASRGTAVAGRVPFDVMVTEAMVHGQPVTAYSDGPVSRELRLAWKKIKGQLGG